VPRDEHDRDEAAAGGDVGGSEKQFTDPLRVYEVQHGRLDEAYLDR
jgi:hypothetical protein